LVVVTMKSCLLFSLFIFNTHSVPEKRGKVENSLCHKERKFFHFVLANWHAAGSTRRAKKSTIQIP
jgi:hypothetical protein